MPTSKKKLDTMATFVCAFCGASNEVEFDPGEGNRVDLHEDCWVCCRPNLVHVLVDEETRDISAEAEEDL